MAESPDRSAETGVAAAGPSDGAHVSWLWQAATRDSGVSWWGERPDWARHAAYWAIAIVVLAVSALDGGAIAVDGDRSLDVAAVVLWLAGILLIGGVVAIVREWDFLPVWRSFSRVLVSLALLIGVLAFLLAILEAEIVRHRDGGSVAPRHLVELLVWHALDVVPALDIPQAVGWEPAVASADAFSGSGVILVRAFVVVVLLAGVKRIWDRVIEADAPPTRSALRRRE